MQPLIDMDVLRYEIGFCGEYKDENGETQIREFDFVADLLDGRIRGICEDVGATQEPIGYLTGSSVSTRLLNRERRYTGEDSVVLAQPLREGWATVKPYKGTRGGPKPFHFDNLTAYILSNYRTVVSNGLEADDLICCEQYKRLGNLDTIICTRDKDLRQCPGWHFGWECGLQPSFGPVLVDNKGWLKPTKDGAKGVGLKFFFYQMLVGDSVDNIPGCPKVGPVKALALLEPCNTKREHELVIIDAYKKAYPDNYEEMLLEQSKLLWMIREFTPDGDPVHYDWKF